jgi:hypothetical protein
MNIQDIFGKLFLQHSTISTQDCVYQFLLTNYGHLVKALSKVSLLGLFDEDAIDTGVSTYMIESFCRQYGVSLYALDLEFNVFHKFIPIKRSHKLPLLVYVVGNAHIFPVLKIPFGNQYLLLKNLNQTIATTKQEKNHSNINTTMNFQHALIHILLSCKT